MNKERKHAGLTKEDKCQVRRIDQAKSRPRTFWARFIVSIWKLKCSNFWNLHNTVPGDTPSATTVAIDGLRGWTTRGNLRDPPVLKLFHPLPRLTHLACAIDIVTCQRRHSMGFCYCIADSWNELMLAGQEQKRRYLDRRDPDSDSNTGGGSRATANELTNLDKVYHHH